MRSVYVCNVAGDPGPAPVTVLEPLGMEYGQPIHNQAAPDLSRDGMIFLNPVAPAFALAAAFALPNPAPVTNAAPTPVTVLEPPDVAEWHQK